MAAKKEELKKAQIESLGGLDFDMGQQLSTIFDPLGLLDMLK